MNVSKAHKGIHKVASKVDGRYAMSRLMLETEPAPGQDKGGCIVATDGRALACIPVELEEGDTAGLVSVEAWQAACKTKLRSGDLSIGANGHLQVRTGPTFERPTDGDFPKWRQVIPAFKVGEVETVSVTLDARYLSALSDALGAGDGAPGVTLTFETSRIKGGSGGLVAKRGGILVTRSNACGAFAVLMPVERDDLKPQG